MAGRLKQAQALAALLLDAYLTVHLQENPHHDRPEWAGMTPQARRPYEALADELLHRGVRLPLSQDAISRRQDAPCGSLGANHPIPGG